MAVAANIANEVEVTLRCTDANQCAVTPEFVQNHFLKIDNVQNALQTGIVVPANSTSKKIEVLIREINNYFSVFYDPDNPDNPGNPNEAVDAIHELVKATDNLGSYWMAKALRVWLTLPESTVFFRTNRRLLDVNQWETALAVIVQNFPPRPV